MSRRSVGISIIMPDAWGQVPEVHKRLSIVAAEIWPIRTDSISVFSSEISDEEDTAAEGSEFLPGEYADENTMDRVRAVLAETQLFKDRGWSGIEDTITALQNAGILFRQRR